MAEVKRPFTAQEALAEAWRCLDCEDAPCSKACPAGIDVRGFIRKIRFENFHGAARRIREANVLGETCALVCPVEVLCEGLCKNTDISHPIAIARLQEFACRYGREVGFEPKEKPHPLRASELDPPSPDLQARRLRRTRTRNSEPGTRNSKPETRVALVGAGPASLACAAELARMGYRPVVFEKETEAGGVPALSIPEDRLPGEVVSREVNRVKDLGVEFRTGRVLGRDFSLDGLFEEGFQAVFLGVGLSRNAVSGVPADEGVEVTLAADLLKRCKGGPKPGLRGRVAVIGGGNTAMDAACAAREAGAREVFLLYRRSFVEMPAWKRELLHAMERGIHIQVLVQPKAYRSVPEGVELILLRTELGEADGSGRRRPHPVPGSEFYLTVGAVVEAVGHVMDPDAMGALKGVKMKRGRIVVDPETWMTRREGVFAAGDVVNGGATVAQAVGEGRRAALGIHRYLTRA